MADNPHITEQPADSWRLHEQRRHDAGKGRFPLPGGRYSAWRRTFRNGTVPRAPRRLVAILTVITGGRI